MSLPGGIFDVPAQNSAECEELARFAVQEHNKKAIPLKNKEFVGIVETFPHVSECVQNTRLEFSRVVKAKMQVVAGTLYYITLEVVEEGQKKIYEAKVWVKPWENFKELQEFKPVGDRSSASSNA